ncbi:hypothetical protein NL676_007869 [Syzygium grande]|nr:hypothetical protein NL676_007869 [Syzygium grande]
MTGVIGKRWLNSMINNLQKQKLCWSVLVRIRQSLASATDGDDLRQNNMDAETPSRSQRDDQGTCWSVHGTVRGMTCWSVHGTL